MPSGHGSPIYQSSAFEALGFLGQLLIALPNLELFPPISATWLRLVGLVLAAGYVLVLLLRAVLPDRVLDASAASLHGIAVFATKLRAGNRVAIVPVTLVAVVVAGFSLFGGRFLGLGGDGEPPSAPAHLRSTGATAQQIDLAWDPASDVGGSGVVDYRITRTDTGLTRSTTATTFHDTMGIGGGQTYSYTVAAVDKAGNVSAKTPELMVATPVSDAAACAVDATAPTAPTNLHASAVTATSVTLEWDDSVDAGDCGLASYRVLRDGQDTGLSAAGTTASQEDLDLDHTYVYSVVARDNAGNTSAPSAAVTIATLARPVQTQDPENQSTPPPPCLLSAPRSLHTNGLPTDDTSITLAWLRPTNACHLDHYVVYRDGSVVGQTTGVSFTATGLQSSTSYAFSVRAHNTDGATSGLSNQVTATTAPAPDTTPPPAPTNLGATVTTTSANLTWSPSAASDLKYYEVFVDSVSKGTTTATSMVVDQLAPGSTHTFYVKAWDNADNQSSSVTASFTTNSLPPPPPVQDAYVGSTTIAFPSTIHVYGHDTAEAPGTTVDVAIDGVSIGSVPLAADGSFDLSMPVDDTGNVGGQTLLPGTGYTLTVTCNTFTASIPVTTV